VIICGISLGYILKREVTEETVNFAKETQATPGFNKWSTSKVNKMKMKLALSTVATCLFASSVYATPVSLSEAQLDSVAAGGVEKVDGFVCPVISTANVLNSGNGIQIAGGDYSILGPDVSIPLHATNDGGAGSPGGAHASPGDTSYTAIWAK
jgi:hypothetical protein